MQKNSKLNNIVKKIKNNIPGFIAGVSLCALVGVSAATYFPSINTSYDNKVSGLKSTNVQDAIDELYNSCKTPTKGGQGILDKTPIVTTGDGLYEDEYEKGRYIYKGANPNNYITFNNEQAGWRIISIEPDNTIKIIKNDAVTTQNWNTSPSSGWDNATLNAYLNNTYYNNLGIEEKYQICSKNFYVGGTTWNSNDLQTQIKEEQSKTWKGNIGLITVSEYIKANTDIVNCGTFSLVNTNANICKNTNWIYTNNYTWWTMTPNNSFAYQVYYLDSFGRISNDTVHNSYNVLPVLYLKSIFKVEGTGAQNDPFVLSL